MARLIISNETIHFTEEGRHLTGCISRLVVDDEIIFIVKYLHPELKSNEIRRIKRVFCEKASSFIWVNYPGNENNDLVLKMGQEIEKFPHLFVLS